MYRVSQNCLLSERFQFFFHLVVFYFIFFLLFHFLLFHLYTDLLSPAASTSCSNVLIFLFFCFHPLHFQLEINLFFPFLISLFFPPALPSSPSLCLSRVNWLYCCIQYLSISTLIWCYLTTHSKVHTHARTHAHTHTQQHKPPT